MKQTVKQMKTTKTEKKKKKKPTSSQAIFKKNCVRIQSKLCATTQKENKANQALRSSQSIEVKELSKGKHRHLKNWKVP